MEKFIVGLLMGIAITLILLRANAHITFDKHPNMTLKHYWIGDIKSKDTK